MKPAMTANSKQYRRRCDAGFTLIEIIISLVVAGILASIAGMGMVSAFSSYAVVRENVGLSQKIQLAATRIQRELLELTDISFQDNSRPYIAYYSAEGQPRAIAKVDDTIKLYNNMEGPISDADLENNGDILTDSVESFTLNYFQGSHVWNGADIRELSTIQFSLKLSPKDVAGSTVDASTLVHLRNNDNYGGSAVTLPVAPPTVDQYSCFISTMLPGSVDSSFTCIRTLMRWILILIPLLWVVRCIKQTKWILPSKADTLSSNKTDGSVLIGIIIAILVFAALGAAIVPMISSSQLHRTALGRSAQAYYLAESGMRYAASQYLNATGEAAKYSALNDLHGFPYQLQENQGTFTVSVNPYTFSVVGDHTNTTTLVTRFYGGLASGYAFPGAGRLSIEDTIYSFSSAPSVDLAGQQVIFVTSPALTVAADTPVYPVARAPSGQTVSDGGDLSLSPGSGDMFPDRNGSFELGGNSYTYRENNRDADILIGIKRTDSLGFSDILLTADEDIRLKKFVKITSTGTVGSGDMMASRDIVYHVQIPEEKEPQRIVFEERFDNLDKWNESVLGTHEIMDVGGNNVLRVTGITQSGVDTPSASLIELNVGAGRFNPDQLDTQVKVGYEPVLPDYYTAGISFRLTDGGDKTYGLSFQRSAPIGNTVAIDNIYNGLKPFRGDKVQAIILWQSTGNNDSDKQWLAYKKLSDVNLFLSTQEITDTASDWPEIVEGKRVSTSIDLSPVPEIPCDYQKLKLKWSTTDCPSLNISINNGEFLPILEGNEYDISIYENTLAFQIRFEVSEANFCSINNIEIVADEFDVSNATLLARFKESSAIEFQYGVGSDSIIDEDRIYGVSSGASATVYGSPIVSSGNWTSEDNASGTILLDKVNGIFDVGGQEQIAINGKSVVVKCAGYSAKEHFIKAYYGTASGCGTPNTNPLDGEKRPYPIDPPELNWPPDEGDPLTADKDYFQLIQWDVINSSVGTVGLVDSLDQPNTLIRSSEASIDGLGSTLGLHTFGKGSLNVYFDDFGYQSFIEQPVAISQPIQY
ncbi:prepilin-type N-terminal cleavage/methylation domain-containing protein [uncultured Desulfosarcina sp.]|uniref:PulJ/GspJ family protein n=1 Tax=uncultured Desulfosarcina sp. TaxID=218289 RepID=UPI0029C6E895|nr:prepilin-type N-terminal cleavage/methylation domain-containing protein [uncultured Desulfosarcina sp.]